MYFSDISKLKNITITTRKQQKLKHIVVLILRMLAILFIVLALAGPELKNDAKQSSDSGTITFFVDNSYSMMAEGSAGRLFENARQEALQIIEQSADNSNFIILSNNNDGNLLRLLGKEAATSELEKLEISSETKKLSDVIVMRNRILLNNNITDCELICSLIFRLIHQIYFHFLLIAPITISSFLFNNFKIRISILTVATLLALN